MTISEIVGIAVRVLLVVILVILSVYDIKNRGVPSIGLIIPAMLAVFYIIFRCVYVMNYQKINVIALQDGENITVSIKNTLVVAALGLLPGIFQIVISLTTRKAGLADGIVLCIIGVMENYVCGIVTWAAGSLLIALVSMVLLCLKKVNRNSKLPFIPFITTGYIFEKLVFGV